MLKHLLKTGFELFHFRLLSTTSTGSQEHNVLSHFLISNKYSVHTLTLCMFFCPLWLCSYVNSMSLSGQLDQKIWKKALHLP